MKKYKHNHTLKMILPIFNTLLALVPGLVVLRVFTTPDLTMLMDCFLIGVPALMVVALVLGAIINLIGFIFSKYSVFMDAETITLKSRDVPAQSIRIENIARAEFDEGAAARGVRPIPSSITLSDASGDESLKIPNPSILMMLAFKRRLKRVKFKFKNCKLYMICCGVFTVIAACICLYLRLWA